MVDKIKAIPRAIGTTVESEKVTLAFRVVSLITSILTILVILGYIPADKLKQIVAVTSSEAFKDGLSAVAILIAAFLPAIQGWRSRDKELPPGVTTDDVYIKTEKVQGDANV